MKKVIWNTPVNHDDSGSLKQHAFISAERGRFYEEKYEGNRALCSCRLGIINEDERFIKLSEIEPEEFDESKACKKCAKIQAIDKSKQ